MANPYVNKVIVNDQIKLDLTGDTVTAETLMQGYTAHDASGAPIVGELVVQDITPILDGTITSVTNSMATSLRKFAFAECDLLSYVNLPSCSIIENNSFSNCVSLEELHLSAYPSIPLSVNPFSMLSALKIIDMPQCSSIIGAAFAKCTLLEQANFPALSSLVANVLQGKKSLTTVKIDNCEYLGANAFNGCTLLSDLYAPAVVSITGATAFNACTNLEDLALPALTSCNASAFNGYTAAVNLSLDSLLSTPANFMVSRANLQTVYAPALTTTGANSFDNCALLSQIECSNLTTLGNATFRSCVNLTNISLPNVRTIGTSVFTRCLTLEKMKLTDVATINTATFNGCSAISSIYIEGNTTKINNSAFVNCVNLYDLWIDTPTVPTFASTTVSVTFAGTPLFNKSGSIHVRASLVDNFKAAAVWKTMSNIIVPI